MKHGNMNFSDETSSKGSIKKLLKALKPFYINIAFSFVCILISTVLCVLAPQWLSKLTDEIANNAATQTISLKKIADFAIILLVFYASNAVCHYVSNFIMTTVTQKYVKGMRSGISRKINSVPLNYFD